MKNATFYLLDNDTTVDGLSAVEQLVCEIAAERWRSGKRVLIACEDEKQPMVKRAYMGNRFNKIRCIRFISLFRCGI